MKKNYVTAAKTIIENDYVYSEVSEFKTAGIFILFVPCRLLQLIDVFSFSSFMRVRKQLKNFWVGDDEIMAENLDLFSERCLHGKHHLQVKYLVFHTLFVIHVIAKWKQLLNSSHSEEPCGSIPSSVLVVVVCKDSHTWISINLCPSIENLISLRLFCAGTEKDQSSVSSKIL